MILCVPTFVPGAKLPDPDPSTDPGAPAPHTGLSAQRGRRRKPSQHSRLANGLGRLVHITQLNFFIRLKARTLKQFWSSRPVYSERQKRRSSSLLGLRDRVLCT